MTPPLRASCALAWSDVIQAVGAAPPACPWNGRLTGVATDSRHVLPGDLFVALVGKAEDGHRFIVPAVRSGAAAVLVQRVPESPPGVPVLCVSDTTEALGALAQAWRRRLGFPLAAVTGSNGKTSTKEMLAAILGVHLGSSESVLVTPGNFNNHVGVPLTLLSGAPSQRMGVVEMGMNAPGEIALLTAMVEPQVGIITNAAEAHLERFGGSVDGVARAKAELWERMSPEAIAVVNLDDSRLPNLAAERSGPILTFGEASSAQVRILAASPADPGHQRISLELAGRPMDIRLPLWGRHHAWNVAAAAAGALALGVSPAEIGEGLSQIQLPGHRSALLTLGGVTVLDDCYNANPASVRVAFSSLKDLNGGGCLGAVLGDLLELGHAAEKMHRALGRHLAASGLQVLIGVGPLSIALCEGAREGGVTETIHRSSPREAATAARERFRPGDRVLVKGSRSMAMEEVITAWIEAIGEEGVT